MYVWDGSVWSEVTTCSGGGGDGDFVKIEGDTMTGPLEIDVSGNPPVGGIAASLLLQGSRPDLTNSSATVVFQNEQSDLTSGIGYLTYRTDPSTSNTSYFKFSKQLEVSRGIFQNLAVRDDATYGVRVERRFTAVEDKEGTGFNIRGIKATSYDSEDGEGSVDNLFAVYHNKPEAGVSKADSIAYFGKILTKNHITTKEYVDARDEELRQDIIELEEEIDAIAPSVERGSWEFTLSGDVGSKPGKFTAYDEFVATSGTPTGLIQNIKSLWFNTLDNGATPHGFDNVEADQLLELFVSDSPDYGLFEVVAVHDFTTSSDYWVIDVNFVRTLEATTKFDNGDVCRLKIANAPSGGTSDLFVLKAGDKVTGELKWILTSQRQMGTQPRMVLPA